MPELPEVETVKRGLNEVLHIGKRKSPKITKVTRRRENIREVIPKSLEKDLVGRKILSITRRAKYLIFEFENGFLLNHLGMTGCWRVCEKGDVKNHDHFLMHLEKNKVLAYNDPRRFGLVTWCKANVESHKKIKDLGPEPLDNVFNADYLFAKTRKVKTNIKTFLMNQKTVVGVGNIYASEALFSAGVRPQRLAHKVTRAECEKVVAETKVVLENAIKAGGSTISDFKQAGGESGYFQHQFHVYGKKGEACCKCKKQIKQLVLGGRSSFYCPQCQK